MTQAQLIARFGNPMTNRAAFERKHMKLVETESYAMHNRNIPSRIYMNRLLEDPLDEVMRELIKTGLIAEIKTWDGLFNVRYQRGSRTKLSRHSWGLAIDMNAAWNPLVKVTPANKAAMRKANVKWSEKFLQVWRDNGFECGADWKDRLDGMHFELKLT
jgi:hypothetical protein